MSDRLQWDPRIKEIHLNDANDDVFRRYHNKLVFKKHNRIVHQYLNGGVGAKPLQSHIIKIMNF